MATYRPRARTAHSQRRIHPPYSTSTEVERTTSHQDLLMDQYFELPRRPSRARPLLPQPYPPPSHDPLPSPRALLCFPGGSSPTSAWRTPGCFLRGSRAKQVRTAPHFGSVGCGPRRVRPREQRAWTATGVAAAQSSILVLDLVEPDLPQSARPRCMNAKVEWP
jgi:hypothetical protein